MSNLVWLLPGAFWLAPLLGALLLLGALRLGGLGALRRGAAVTLQALSAACLLAALAQPALVQPDTALHLVLVLDTSASVGPAGQQQALAFARGVLANAAPADQVRLVATGTEAHLLTAQDVLSGTWPLAGGPAGATPDPAGQQQGTDLAAGLRLAGSLLADSGRRRVVLLSDGWETQGQAAAEAARLRARAVDVQVVALPALGDHEVLVEDVSAPAYVRIGDPLNSQMRVFSTAATSATLVVTVDGTALPARPVNLVAGENTFDLPAQAQSPGYHQIAVRVDAPGDLVAANNTGSATVVVKPQPHVLVLEDRPGESAPLVQALQSQQMTVDVRSPSTVPPQLAGLDPYDAVVLDDVAATSLTLDQQRTLQEIVRRNGRGLVAVGGPTSFVRGGYADSVFEDVLPVSSRPPPRPQQGPIALVLVLDRSGSMVEVNSGDVHTTKLAMAKEAARLAVDSLHPGDTIGLLAFDDGNQWIVPLQTVGDATSRQGIKDTIGQIDVGGGTAIYGAVQAAKDAIAGVPAPTRHMVLLTDGQEYGSHDYGPLLADMHAANITLSTIGIGSDADQELLTRLAKLGNGRYYFTERIDTIPRIVFKEVDVALKEAVKEGALQPEIASPSPVLRGFAPQDLPRLNGYDVTTAKPDAVVGLVSEQNDPLLAHWNYGLGRVVAFTSAANPQWGGPWLGWPAFAHFWSQAVRWTMASPVNPQLQPAITVGAPPDGPPGALAAHIVVESLQPNNAFADLATVSAALRSPSGAVTTTVLAQTGPGRYEADVPLSEPGAYEARLSLQSDPTADPAQETAGFSVPPSPELRHPGTNTAFLRALTAGAAPLTRPAQALDPAALADAAPTLAPLWTVLVPPGLILLLASVAVRRVAWRRRLRES